MAWLSFPDFSKIQVPSSVARCRLLDLLGKTLFDLVLSISNHGLVLTQHHDGTITGWWHHYKPLQEGDALTHPLGPMIATRSPCSTALHTVHVIT